jgi:hypothetical protein
MRLSFPHKSKGKVVPILVIKACEGFRAPHILNLATRR